MSKKILVVADEKKAAFEGDARTIDAHIKNLRQKLGDDPKHPRYILTVFGVGYKLAEVASRHAQRSMY